ncbi:MAG: helix-turn-helix domain-containing protein [Brachybacterium sp.]|nr:helix-turn-helix domain-containing protein [Brachybacterium sp.]
MTDRQTQALGARVRAAREGAGLSQVGLASRIPGLHQASLARIEAGDRALRALEAVAIARETNVDLENLLRGSDRAAEDLVRATASTVPQQVQGHLEDFAELARDRRNEIERLADAVPEIAEGRHTNIQRAVDAWNIALRAAAAGAREVEDDIVAVDVPLA